MPSVASTPNRIWAALVAACEYGSVALSGKDYVGLLPVRWQAACGRGSRLDHRMYDHEAPGPPRGQSSGIVVRGGN